ncbi:MgtC/SapB family protein [Virgibacillus litoralis]
MDGWEREHSNKHAGFKTHLLVSLGSCFFNATFYLRIFRLERPSKCQI